MNNKKGFTLIELLAVILILGVIMTIAIPNIVSTLDKNKRDSFINDAKRIISSATYTMRSDTTIEYPDNASVVILSLKRLRNLDLEKSSYETYYSKEKSFVAIIKESLFNGDSTYVYFVHLVSCAKASCVAEDSQELEMNRGINLVREDDLQNSDRYELVLSGSDVKLDYLDQASTNYHEIKQKVSRSNAVYYE